MSAVLQDKVALVTGGATGIGEAIARRFAAEGARVFITGRRQAELEATAADIGSGVEAIRADVGDLADLDALFATIAQRAGRLDVLVANAGGGDFQAFADVSEADFDRTFDTNVKGTFFTVQKALGLMGTGGSIILTGSTTGSMGTANFSVYSATKAAIRNFVRSWILDLKDSGLRVNVISPGPVKTPGLLGLVPEEAQEEMLSSMAAQVPLGRVADPSEIAAAALFLASDEASFVHGSELFVDGGVAQI